MTQQATHTTKDTFFIDYHTALDLALEIRPFQVKDLVYAYLERHYTGGKINDSGANIAFTGYSLLKTLDYLETNDIEDVIDLPNAGNAERVLIGYGEVTKETQWRHSDPYETAGGYQQGVIDEGEEVDIYLKKDYRGFVVEYQTTGSLLTDHYNNNFFGASTGGGTETYKRGEKRRRVNLRPQVGHLYSSEVKVTKISSRRVESYIKS